MVLGIDLTDVSEQGSTIPDGSYHVVVEKAEIAPTKTGGEMIKVQYKIKDAGQRGRMVFDQFNIKNANPQAVQIGLVQLKGMMKAGRHPNPNRLESMTELVGLQLIIRTKAIDDPQYGPSVRVKGYGMLSPGQGAISNALGAVEEFGAVPSPGLPQTPTSEVSAPANANPFG